MSSRGVTDMLHQSMRQVIQIQLKRGLNTYSGKRGAPRSVVEIRSAYLGPVVVMEVDPTVVAPDCSFTVATFMEKLDENVVGNRIGHVGNWFVYSPCFTAEYLAKTSDTKKKKKK